GLPARRTGAASSQPALPGVLRGRRAAVDRHPGVAPHRRPPPSRLADRRVLRRLRHGAHRGRAVPRARLVPGIPAGHELAQHGHGAVGADGAVWPGTRPARIQPARPAPTESAVSTELGRRIARRIALTGPISVADFMAEALGHPTLGYYRRAMPLGAAGDFITAPEISQMFGEMI